MIVVTRNAENTLIQHLQVYVQQSPKEICFYFCFSKLNISRDIILNRLTNFLQTVSASCSTQLYMCHDNDVFFFMRGLVHEEFRLYVQMLQEILEVKDLAPFSYAFETGKFAQRIKALCEEKINDDKIEKEKMKSERKRELVQHHMLQALAKIDDDMVATISARRNQRRRDTIVIADDDMLARTIVNNILREDYNVICAKNGKEALIECVTHAPDVLFLDIGLPDMSGYDVLEQIFYLDPEVYVIMLSGKNTHENIVKALHMGAQGFIGKPFTRDKLFRYIERAPSIFYKKNPDIILIDTYQKGGS